MIYTAENINIRKDIPVYDLSDGNIWDGNTEDPEIITKPENLAYCIYTSGTTGQPKGVVLEHHSLLNHLFVMREKFYDEKEHYSTPLFTSFAFDFTVPAVFGAIPFGDKLAVMKDVKELVNYSKENKLAVFKITPSYFNGIYDEFKDHIGQVKTMVFGGESFTEKTLENVYKAFGPSTRVFNEYGPTEATVFTTVAEMGEGIPVTIGKPVSNSQIYIMNGDTMCGIGIPGELCVSGEGIAREYLNRPDLTAEKFVKNPFGEGRMYRTGDLARWLPDGNIEYLGRIDEQVKIRGFRIELGEIESRIRETENIKDCAVIAKADASGDKAIYAYYTSDNEVAVSEIRDSISGKLPEYMIPAYMMQIESIPVTRNGKLDKRALPEIEAKATREYVAPRNDIEEKICTIFSEILNVERVGVKDSFFELGGHSLRATRLVNRIESETGTRIALKDVFSHPTAEQLAVLAGGESEEYVPIPKAEEKEYYPMSSAQKRTYLIQQMDTSAVTYNMPQYLRINGKVYPEKLRSALQSMLDRHEILRTKFTMIDGEAVQVILDHVDADFEYVRSDELDEKLIAEHMKPFDLVNPPLVRVMLVDKGDYHLLMIDMHHIVSDGMSVNIFKSELMSLYNGKELPDLTHQFKDYSEWMRSRDLSGQAEYWKSQFDDEIPVLDIPTDFPRSQDQSYSGTMIGCVLDKDLSKKIKEYIGKTGTTDYIFFLAALMVMFSKYSRQEDIVIGSPMSGRTHRDTESMLGMFVNTLAMRGRPEKNKVFSDFLAEIKNICFKAYENQEYPFEELVEAVNVQRDMSRNPIFDVLFTMHNNEHTVMSFEGVDVQAVGFESTISKFDLSFDIAFDEQGYDVVLEYCTDLFLPETADSMLEHFKTLLMNIINSPYQMISMIDMTEENEREKILNDFNATETEYPRDKTVVELFEEQVKKTPDNIALVFEDQKVTYAELNARANSLAHKLREMGVKPDDFVAIIADRSIEMIAGIYGIIKSGGAYVPIDPTYPEERINYILDDCKPKAVLKFTNDAVNISEGITVIDLSDESVWNRKCEDIALVNKPSDLVYCIYTSGTTGKSKGVLIEQKNLTAYVSQFVDYYKINADTVILQQAYVGFDTSIEELYPVLISGGKMVIVDKEHLMDSEKMKKTIINEKINIISCSPLLIKEMDYLRETEMKTLISGGDVLKREYFEGIKDTNIGVYNTYGPTEATVCATYYKVNFDDENTNIPIGKPIANSKVYILNGSTMCGIGVPGELCIAGGGVARGYLNRPELTAEKFVKNPFGEGRMYRSGDLARWLPDGNIEYLGRIDEQVKIRGFRIELGEIESRIREIENIKDCAVIAKADSTGDKAIYAYYTSDIEIGVSDVRDKLAETLPEYMVPAYMMQIEAIPVTRNGKLDKRALPEIVVKNTREYIPPRNDIEKCLCEAFGEILNIEQVSIKESFFELGGDSIKAIRIISKMRNSGYSLTVKDIMSGKTVERIVRSVQNDTGIDAYDQGEISGVVENTPIVRDFGKWKLPHPAHFNQAMMFNVEGISNDIIRRAVEEIVKHHDALRAVYRENRLVILPISESRLFDFYEFDYSAENDKFKAIEDKCTEIQGSIDLENGPLVKIAVFELGGTKQMMFCVHHLVIDGVSWRIIGEDLDTAFEQLKKGRHVTLPEKTASIIEWSHKLNKYGEKLKEKDGKYWSDVIPSIKDGLIKGDFREDQPGFGEVKFDEKITEILKKNSSNAFGAKIDEVILAAFTMSVRSVTGQEKIALKLEGHGREALDSPILIDRTVGWFTNIYAVVLKCCENEEDAIISVKDDMRKIPDSGMGYGFVEHEIDPEICFNFHGELNIDKNSSETEYSVGLSSTYDNEIEKISVNGGIFSGKLCFTINSSDSRFGQKFIDLLIKEFESAVKKVADFCSGEIKAIKTAADLTEKNLDDSELDFLNSLFS